MTLGAREVPVLAAGGPVQPVAGLDVLSGVEVEPALPALRLRARIPGNAQRLHAAAGKFDQVLLQRMHAERVLDLEVGELAVRAVGVDDELTVTPRERRRRPGVGKFRAGEVAQHRLLVGNLHREVVVGALPRRELFRVAARALGAADVTSVGNGDERRRRTRRRSGVLRPERTRCGQDDRERGVTCDPGATTARAGGRCAVRDGERGCARPRAGAVGPALREPWLDLVFFFLDIGSGAESEAQVAKEQIDPDQTVAGSPCRLWPERCAEPARCARAEYKLRSRTSSASSGLRPRAGCDPDPAASSRSAARPYASRHRAPAMRSSPYQRWMRDRTRQRMMSGRKRISGTRTTISGTATMIARSTKVASQKGR